MDQNGQHAVFFSSVTALCHRLAVTDSLRERIGPKLELHGYRLCALATLLEPWCAVAARGPQSPTLPAGFCIVDAPVKAFGIEAEWIGHAQHDHLAVF